ncbi:MAG: hypothetical protein LBV72_16720 [Tannerella sp.]|jgi:hypothetical protein|nr:hypothetical protein [Tannerella sp.]
MKTKAAIAVLMSAIFFVSCEKAHERLEYNVNQYNVCMGYSNLLLVRLWDIRIHPDVARVSAQKLIDYVDTCFAHYGKEIPASVEEVNSMDDAMLYYMSVYRQMAVMTCDFADNANVWTQEEAEELFYSKMDPLVSAAIKTVRRWDELQEEYAKQHGIKLYDFNKIERLQ